MQSDINVTGAVAGDITIAGPWLGNIDVGGNVAGMIEIMGDLESNAGFQVGGRLGRGRVLIDGLCSGDISIAESTGRVSLIHLSDGLGVGGSITINSGEAAVDPIRECSRLYAGPLRGLRHSGIPTA